MEVGPRIYHKQLIQRHKQLIQREEPMGILDKLLGRDKKDEETAIDPVCKMTVSVSGPSGGTSEHEGTTYYFCAPGCKKTFDKEPTAYL